jgi:non-ribosomal peptide synthetase-like protein
VAEDVRETHLDRGREAVEVLTVGAVVQSTIHEVDRQPLMGTEPLLAEIFAEVAGFEQVSIDNHFFDDMGADSMVMARFCARIRKREDLPSVSMKDIYRNPTIRSLASALRNNATVVSAEPPVLAGDEPSRPVGTAGYVLCGTLQLLYFVGFAYLAGVIIDGVYGWSSAASDPIDIYLRALLAGTVAFLVACAIPILAKWLLIGRWKAQSFRIWSLAYFRFWLVKSLVRASPLVIFAGTPLYTLYLRALGARIGRRVVIASRNVPVCTDLLTIDDDVVIRSGAFFTTYRAQAGLIQTGPVTLGSGAFVGEAAVLDIQTSLGSGSQLGHSSSLHVGRAVPDGERWHGSPAQPADVDYLVVEAARCGPVRRALYVAIQLLLRLAVALPLLIVGVVVLLGKSPWLVALLGGGVSTFAGWTVYRDALVATLVLFVGFLFTGLLLMTTVPRLLNIFLKPDKKYCLYGFHYWLQRVIATMTNVRFFTYLFGDSSYIVPYVRCLGYDLSPVVQTGSNFGLEVRHENPFFCSVGSATMVADGLSVLNVDFSSTSFRISRTSIGRRNFLGNDVIYPPRSKVGDNCLLATKVMVPIDGPLREGVGLLGAPSFEIPRSVERDGRFDQMKTGRELHRRLSAKNRHNLFTIALYLFVRWLYFFATVLLGTAAVAFYYSLGSPTIALFTILMLVFSVAYFVPVDRVTMLFHPLRPRFCSIYDVNFWRWERFWKVPGWAYLEVFNGTPFKVLLWRLLGVRIGRRVFDDGCVMAERTLVSIGDHAVLNAGSKIQCHSQEDGTFKADRTAIGAGATLGLSATVHYGVTVGDGAVLAPGSFLMKGEEVPRGARWAGNPAREMPSFSNTAGVPSLSDSRAIVHGGGR